MEASSGAAAGIAQTNQSFMAAFNAGDAAGVAAHYTADGQLAPPNSDIVQGIDTITGFWQGAMDMGVKSAKLETAELDDYGGIAVEQGRYRLADAEGNAIDHGKYLVIWKRDGDTWKLHRDIWNSSTPAA
jgi:ketosteroid isomerase-like protein